MDLKFILLLAVAVTITLLLHEFNSLKKTVNRKLNDIENKFNTYNQDLHNIVKRESVNSSNRFKTYTSEMVQEIRKMNKIENQHVTLISDGFDDDDTMESNKHIPYLSDSHHGCNPPRKKTKHSDKESLYMSTSENEPIFIIKDADNQMINSAHVYTADNVLSDSKLSINNNECTGIQQTNTLIHSTHSSDNKKRVTPPDEKSINSSGSSNPISDNHSHNTVSPKSNVNDIDININKLQTIQNEIASRDDTASHDITFGSTKVKKTTNINISSNNIVDDLSLGTTDDNTFKLYSIGKYTKDDLIQIAKRHNITIPDKINKENLYNTIKNTIN